MSITKDDFLIPSLEQIISDYEEVVRLGVNICTLKDALQFEKEHNIEVEINYDDPRHISEDINEIEIVRIDHWGCLNYIYFIRSENQISFDVSIGPDRDTLISSTNIFYLKDDYKKAISLPHKCISNNSNDVNDANDLLEKGLIIGDIISRLEAEDLITFTCNMSYNNEMMTLAKKFIKEFNSKTYENFEYFNEFVNWRLKNMQEIATNYKEVIKEYPFLE